MRPSQTVFQSIIPSKFSWIFLRALHRLKRLRSWPESKPDGDARRASVGTGQEKAGGPENPDWQAFVLLTGAVDPQFDALPDQ